MVSDDGTGGIANTREKALFLRSSRYCGGSRVQSTAFRFEPGSRA
jgi:hypothetical protein